MVKSIELSVVIPVYNSAEIFPELYRRLLNTLDSTVNSFEIIAVVDGCADDSADVIASFCKKDNQLKLVELSRNFGHQSAITAGLELTSGEMIIVMDDDLEDPPEILPKFIDKAKEGYDIVYGIRKKRKVSIFRRLLYNIFYRVLNIFSEVEMPHDAGDFGLMRRPVVEYLNYMPESNRYLRGMKTWLGFRQVGIQYERGARTTGESGYSMIKYIKFAIDAILSFSYKPLIYVSITGLIISFIGFFFGLRIIIMKIFQGTPDVPGWVSLMVIVLFIGGVQLLSIGIVGQYIARIYDETKRRPRYVIRRKIGFDKYEKYD